MIKKFNDFISLNEGFSFKNYNLSDIIENPDQPFVSEDVCKYVCKKLVKELDETTPEEDSELVLAKVIVFLGVNFSMYPNIIKDHFVTPLIHDNIFNVNNFGNSVKDDDKWNGHMNFWLCLHAAWPSEDDFSNLSSKDREYCKKIMKKYFPWRLSDSGEINWLKDLDME